MISLGTSPAKRSYVRIAVAIIITTIVGIIFTYNHAATTARPLRTSEFLNRTREGANRSHGEQLGDMSSLSDEIHELYKSAVLPVALQNFTDKDTGLVHQSLNGAWSRLGKDLCIADIDTRVYDRAGQMLSGTFNYDEADPLSAGMLNHFVYASIHGYSYHLINSEPWPNNDRDSVWSRLPNLRRLLDECQIVVVVDADVVFQHLDLSFEWLLNRWNFTKDTSLAMPWDVKYEIKRGRKKLLGWTLDPKGQLSINAGVVIAQNLSRTKEIVEAWIGCPDDLRFPGCDKLRHGWPAEQGAFANYIRYAYNETTDLKTISCNDANGFPGQGNDCDGTFLRHFTSSKVKTKEDVGRVLLDGFMKVFASRLVKAG